MTSLVAEGGTDRENFPAASVVAASTVPFTVTVAPASGTPLSSVTTPVMVLFCARAI